MKSARGFTGFTLMEVMLATALLAIMSLLLFGALRINVTLWDRGEEKTDQTSRMLIVQQFLRQQLSSALPIIEQSQDRVPVLRFAGDTQHIDYMGLLPHRVRGGLYHMRIYLQEQQGYLSQSGRQLRVAVYPPGTDITPQAVSLDDVVLLDGIEAFAITYQYVDPDVPQADQWLNEWSRSVMPRLMAIHVKLVGEPGWPDLLIHPSGVLPQ